MADKKALVDSGATDNFMHPLRKKNGTRHEDITQTKENIQHR
jgi:hypothetical protein